MDHAFRFTAEKIRKRIALVTQHRSIRSEPLQTFEFRRAKGAMAAPELNGSAGGWEEIPPGTYWAGADTHFTLRSRFSIPPDWANPALYLPFGTLGDIFNHPEALAYIDGKIVGSADRHHHLLELSSLTAGEHDLVLHGWTGLAGWPPSADAPDKLLMRPCFVVDLNPALEEFLTLSSCVLESAELLDADDQTHNALLDVLDTAFLGLDTRHPLQDALHASAEGALETLKSGLGSAGFPMNKTLTAIGHAHMDIAYLWPVEESRVKNARTYANVLRLMDRHGDYCFTHSQPQLYDYTKRDFPELHAQIRQRVNEGRWEPVGGMWVEPDSNLPGAESLARQILLGRRWFREEFGEVETPILWLPDTFGFTWCLPQLMKLSGLEMLVTNKLNWNQHNRMPSSASWWQGMDGSKVLFLLLTTPRPVQHLPFPTNYKSDLSGFEVKGTATHATQPALHNLPVCFGYGDGGGGPTENLIARAKAFAHMPSMPKVQMGRAADVLAAAKAVGEELPTWSDELYMEGHRGVLTSQAWIKRANRKAEAALHRAELLTVLAGTYQQTEKLTEAWKLLCLNQFHDILAGTAITRVFNDAREDYARISDICSRTEASALEPLNGSFGVLNPSPLQCNSLGFSATPVEDAQTQQVEGGYLVNVPRLQGYEATSLEEASNPEPISIREEGPGYVLENTYLRAELNANGALVRAFDKLANRELLAKGQHGNQLWAFEDRPLSWDAWDIDPFFEDRAEEIVDCSTIEIVESGPLRVALRLTRRFRNSTITQDIRLTDRSARLEFSTAIDWHERHTLLKAAFPLSVNASHATYDIQWGQIDRPTSRDTKRDASRFEVCGHKWAALHDGKFAVAVLNDGKYGHDAHGSVMRLTLIKSSTMPDPEADQGLHEFTYALYPQAHAGFEAIRAEAEALNHPLLMAPGLGDLPRLIWSDAPNVVIETIKPAEDGNGFVARVYEAEGRATETVLSLSAPPRAVTETNLMEDVLDTVPYSGSSIPLTLRPFQILTLLIEPDSA